MREGKGLLETLGLMAPGTPLREGLDNILHARTGSLIAMGDVEAVLAVSEGGFRLDCEFSPAALYELAKMDGAIVLTGDCRRILAANLHLVPQGGGPSSETGIRHRIAERVARQTSARVVAISQRRSFITLFQGNVKYVLPDPSMLLAKANQAIQTMEKYRLAMDNTLRRLSALELANSVTLEEVVKALQRLEMVRRVKEELNGYIVQLGREGELVRLQMEELWAGVEAQRYGVLRDYCDGEDHNLEQADRALRAITTDDLVEPVAVAKALGYPGGIGVFEHPLVPKGYRLLTRIPRLPVAVVDNLVRAIGNLPGILLASNEELDRVEGIGEARARTIQAGLQNLQRQVLTTDFDN